MSTTGPPELPGETGASIWSNPPSADDPSGKGALQPLRVTGHEDVIADREPAGGVEPERRGRQPLNFDQREVEVRRGKDPSGRVCPFATGEPDPAAPGAGAGDDVLVGEEFVRGDEEATAVAGGPAARALHLDVDDRGQYLPRYLAGAERPLWTCLGRLPLRWTNAAMARLERVQ
jgi:hypothetical protein